MPEIRRVKTGIQGLDKLIEGGFLENSVIMVGGEAGTGKTIFSMQFLKHGAENGENVLYISTEESEKNIKNGFKLFGWDMDKLKINVLAMCPDELEEEWENVLANRIDKQKIKRVAVDTISLVGLYYKDEYSIRRYLYKFISSLKDRHISCMLVSEIPKNGGGVGRTDVEEFVVDGVLLLQFIGTGGKYERGVTIRKMRWTQHTQDIHPYRIVKNKGIILGK